MSQHVAAWITDSFTVEGTGTWGEGMAVVFRISAIDKDGIDTPGTEGQVKLSVGAAVEVKAAGGDAGHPLGRSNVIIVAIWDTCHTRSGGDRSCAAFQGGDALLKGGGCGIYDASINIAEALQRK